MCAQPILCDNGDGNLAALMVSNLQNGDTFAVCPVCIPLWAKALGDELPPTSSDPSAPEGAPEAAAEEGAPTGAPFPTAGEPSPDDAPATAGTDETGAPPQDDHDAEH